MGDRRFDAAYRAVVEAPDRAAAIRALDDVEVVHALAAASKKMDAYLANVLAVEVLNRNRRQRAVLYGVVVGLSTMVVVRSIIFIALGQGLLSVGSLVAVIPAAGVGFAVYRLLLRRPRD